jgi:hypothetical protein
MIDAMRIHRYYVSTAFKCLAGLVAAGGLAACGTTVSPGSTTTTTTHAVPTSECVAGPGITQRVVTTHYVMVLDLGPPQAMYSQAQVASHKLTKAQMANGEVMISGTMTPYPGMSGMSGMAGMGTTTTAKSSGMSGMSGMAGMGTTTTAKSSGMSGMSGMAGMAGMSTTTAGSGGKSSTMSSTAVPASDYRHLEVHVCSLSTGKVITGGHPSITVVDNTAHDMSTAVPVAVMQGIEAGVADYHYGNNVIMPPGRHFTVKVVFGSDTATFHVSTPAA